MFKNIASRLFSAPGHGEKSLGPVGDVGDYGELERLQTTLRADCRLGQPGSAARHPVPRAHIAVPARGDGCGWVEHGQEKAVGDDNPRACGGAQSLGRLLHVGRSLAGGANALAMAATRVG